MKKLIILLLTLLTLTACAGSSSASFEGEWKLVSYNQISTQPDVETTIEFADGQLIGSVGCNNFSGGYKVKGDVIEFGPIMTTEMFCEAVADQESGTYGVLQGNAGFALNGGILTITSADGDMSITLERK